jgi:hypothetical protein
MPRQKKDTSSSKSIVIFEDHPVRRVWVEKDEKWYFAISDVVRVLTDSINPTDYIKKMRLRDAILSEGWGQIVTPLSIETVFTVRSTYLLHVILAL